VGISHFGCCSTVVGSPCLTSEVSPVLLVDSWRDDFKTRCLPASTAIPTNDSLTSPAFSISSIFSWFSTFFSKLMYSLIDDKSSVIVRARRATAVVCPNLQSDSDSVPSKWLLLAFRTAILALSVLLPQCRCVYSHEVKMNWILQCCCDQHRVHESLTAQSRK
jgi:hypothetical protein